VETVEKIEFLRRLNGEFAQGFYFYELFESPAAEALLRSRRAGTARSTASASSTSSSPIRTGTTGTS
jgi:hypothetical protein